MFRNISVKAKLFGVLCAIQVILLSFAGIVWNTTGSLSSAAHEMGQGKDVVADILPPPLYVIEAELVVMQIQQAKSDEIAGLLEKLTQLKKDYDERNAYWQRSGVDATVKNSLLGAQRNAADAFWQLASGDFTSAAKAGDAVSVQRLGGEIYRRYQAQRSAVDKTVKVANTYADETLGSLNERSASARWVVLGLAITSILFATAMMLWVFRSILSCLGGEPAMMRATARRIADGDLTNYIFHLYIIGKCVSIITLSLV